MTPTPETLAEDMPIVDAIRFFEQAEHRSYPVIDAQGRPIANASRADALRWRQANLAEGVTPGELLSDGSMPVVHPATPATDIANLMIAEDMGRICVVDQIGRAHVRTHVTNAHLVCR